MARFSTLYRLLLIWVLLAGAISITLFVVKKRPELVSLIQTRKAGEATHIIPAVWREEKQGRKNELARAAPVYWRDFVQTDSGARARIRLIDQSILNIGSGSRLQILPQVSGSIEAPLILEFGKIRVKIQPRSKDGKFQLQTQTALVGVIGTDLFTEALSTKTKVICLEGTVRVRNVRPDIPGEVLLRSRHKTEVLKDRVPLQAKMATDDEIMKARADTSAEPTEISSIVQTPYLYAGETVMVSGMVVDSGLAVFSSEPNFYKLSDGTGTIMVGTLAPLPSLGDRVRVKGTVAGTWFLKVFLLEDTRMPY